MCSLDSDNIQNDLITNYLTPERGHGFENVIHNLKHPLEIRVFITVSVAKHYGAHDISRQLAAVYCGIEGHTWKRKRIQLPVNPHMQTWELIHESKENSHLASIQQSSCTIFVQLS